MNETYEERITDGFMKKWWDAVESALADPYLTDGDGALACSMWTNEGMTDVWATPVNIIPVCDPPHVKIYFYYEKGVGYVPNEFERW